MKSALSRRRQYVAAAAIAEELLRDEEPAKEREKAREDLRKLLHYRSFIFIGSSEAGLTTPTSDVDVLVSICHDNVRREMNILDREVQKNDDFETKYVIRPQSSKGIPLYTVKSTRSTVTADITFATPGCDKRARDNTRLLKTYSAQPSVARGIRILKGLLRGTPAASVRTKGLSSYAMAMTFIAYGVDKKLFDYVDPEDFTRWPTRTIAGNVSSPPLCVIIYSFLGFLRDEMPNVKIDIGTIHTVTKDQPGVTIRDPYEDRNLAEHFQEDVCELTCQLAHHWRGMMARSGPLCIQEENERVVSSISRAWPTLKRKGRPRVFSPEDLGLLD